MHSQTVFCCATVAVLEAQYKVSKQKYVAASQERMGLSKLLMTGSLAGWQPVEVFVVFLSAKRIHEVS